jgi:LuxR family transcriptional regulator, maltose regulon positive regulatory protein
MAEGFVRIFKDEGPLLLALIGDMLVGMKDISSVENSSLRSFAEKILRPSGTAVLSAATHANHAGHVSHGMPQGKTHAAVDNELTVRELDVLMLLAQGHGNQAIAEKLFVSVTTVKTHLRNINLKLGAHTRTEAISLARKLSIIH